MATVFTPTIRDLNKRHKNLGCKISIGSVGSFMFLRIEDPLDTLTFASAATIVQEVGKLFKEKGWAVTDIPMRGNNFFTDGIYAHSYVANWPQH